MKEVRLVLFVLVVFALIWLIAPRYMKSPTYVPGARVRIKASDQIGLVVNSFCDFSRCDYNVRANDNELRLFGEIEIEPAPTPYLRATYGQ